MPIKVLLTVLFAIGMLSAQVRVIHVIGALCDNVNQGIVPVPEKIGNEQNPVNNLYWGCGFGVKTYEKNPFSHILERLLFTHKDSSVYMVADAYDGAYIKQAIIDFLNYASGKSETL